MCCSMSTDLAWQNFCNNDYKNIVIEKKKKEGEKFIPKSSDLYISTQTKIAFFNQEIKLNDLFWKIPIIPYQKKSNGVIKKQMKMNCHTPDGVIKLDEKIKDEKMIQVDIISQINNPDARKVKFKDVRKVNIGLCKKDLLCLRKKKKGAMMNCIVVILRLKYGEIFKEVHIKIFNTGKLEIPGIQDDAFLLDALDHLVLTIQPFIQTELTYAAEKIDTVLINSNFTSNYYINRNTLYNILKYKYKLNTCYDPCSYPGVRSKFYYNEIHPDKNGVCMCKNRCNKKGSGKKINSCLEVSFMIFRTGSVLIVGNCDKKVLNIIYDFVVKILHDEYDQISIGVAINKIAKKKKKKKIRKRTILVKNST